MTNSNRKIKFPNLIEHIFFLNIIFFWHFFFLICIATITILLNFFFFAVAWIKGFSSVCVFYLCTHIQTQTPRKGYLYDMTFYRYKIFLLTTFGIFVSHSGAIQKTLIELINAFSNSFILLYIDGHCLAIFFVFYFFGSFIFLALASIQKQ